MSEPTDGQIAEEEGKALEGQIFEHLKPDKTELYEWALAGLTELTNALRDAVIPEEAWALVANHLRSIEKDLATKRREVEADATHVASEARKAEPFGEKVVYESTQGALVEETTRVRSYNSSGILAAVMEHGDLSFVEAIVLLTNANALELKWKISFFENVADKLGFDYRTARHEIEDGDAEYLVGVVSTTKMVRG